MRFIITAILCSSITLCANAAEFEDHLRLDLAAGSASQPNERNVRSGQIAFAWELRPGISAEFWQSHQPSEDYSYPSLGADPAVNQAEELHRTVERTVGLGLRYDFATGKKVHWRPFLRAGWARVHGTFEYLGTYRDFESRELVYERQSFALSVDARYVGIGTSYALSEHWNASVQLQYVSSELQAGTSTDQTQLLFGIGYRY